MAKHEPRAVHRSSSTGLPPRFWDSRTQADEAVDKTAETVVTSTQDEEQPPPRLIQDMINHRRMLKGQLYWVEQFLRKHGVKV